MWVSAGCRPRHDLHGRGGARRRPGGDARAGHPGDAGAVGGLRPARRRDRGRRGRRAAGRGRAGAGGAGVQAADRRLGAARRRRRAVLGAGADGAAAGLGGRRRHRAAGRPARARLRDAPGELGAVQARPAGPGGRAGRACAGRARPAPSPRRRRSPTRRATGWPRATGSRCTTWAAARSTPRCSRRDGAGFRLAGPPEGVEQLGGIDFDEAVFRHVLAALGRTVAGARRPDPATATGAGAAAARLRRGQGGAVVQRRHGGARWRCPGSPRRCG